MKKAAGFSPARRLRKSCEFRRVRQSGKKLNSRFFALYYQRRIDGLARLGLTVSKKMGNAVQRNRVKRLLREFFRQNTIDSTLAVDISIIARPGAADLKYNQICEELTPLLALIGRGVL